MRGATVHLVGRTRESPEAVAEDTAVEEHARAVASKAGSVDVSFNLIFRGDVQGIPLVDMTAEDFMRPVTTGLMSTLNTARSGCSAGRPDWPKWPRRRRSSPPTALPE